jgi:Mg-chelatase subunit ChlD
MMNGLELPALWDTTSSKVSIPESVTESDADVIKGVVETACYTRLAEAYMIQKYKESEGIWAERNMKPSWTYFGAHDGLFRSVPALHQRDCGAFDPRRRPWFVAASSGPKDVLLVIDVSQSMDRKGRINITKDAAVTIVKTLTVADRFIVIAFSTEADQLGEYPSLIPATSDNKEKLKKAIYELEPDGTTNFYATFETAFDALDNTIHNEESSDGRIAVLFLTDGKIKEDGSAEEREKETSKVITLVNERTEWLAAIRRKVTIFTYSLGEDSDHDVVKSIACKTGGIWTRGPVELIVLAVGGEGQGVHCAAVFRQSRLALGAHRRPLHGHHDHHEVHGVVQERRAVVDQADVPVRAHVGYHL